LIGVKFPVILNAFADNDKRGAVSKVTWNPEAMKTDSEAVNKHFKPEFRSGWHFPTSG